MNKTLKQMLTAAVALGGNIVVRCDGEVDYSGTNVADAMEAIEAVDEAHVVLRSVDGNCGAVMVINDLDEDEQIANSVGWCDVWLAANAKD